VSLSADLSRASIAAAAVAAAFAAIALPSAPAASLSAACSVRSYPGQPVKHVKNLDLKPNYNSFPPTSGTHYYLPARFDIYDFALPQIAVVHNLEHGGVAVQYGRKVPRTTVAKLRAWYLKNSNGLLVAPLPELGSKIALTAWNAPPYSKTPPDPGRGWVATCTGFDAATFSSFVKAHRYKGGERFPKSKLARQRQ
jgi:hypothetical protein